MADLETGPSQPNAQSSQDVHSPNSELGRPVRKLAGGRREKVASDVNRIDPMQAEIIEGFPSLEIRTQGNDECWKHETRLPIELERTVLEAISLMKAQKQLRLSLAVTDLPNADHVQAGIDDLRPCIENCGSQIKIHFRSLFNTKGRLADEREFIRTVKDLHELPPHLSNMICDTYFGRLVAGFKFRLKDLQDKLGQVEYHLDEKGDHLNVKGIIENIKINNEVIVTLAAKVYTLHYNVKMILLNCSEVPRNAGETPATALRANFSGLDEFGTAATTLTNILTQLDEVWSSERSAGLEGGLLNARLDAEAKKIQQKSLTSRQVDNCGRYPQGPSATQSVFAPSASLADDEPPPLEEVTVVGAPQYALRNDFGRSRVRLMRHDGSEVTPRPLDQIEGQNRSVFTPN